MTAAVAKMGALAVKCASARGKTSVFSFWRARRWLRGQAGDRSSGAGHNRTFYEFDTAGSALSAILEFPFPDTRLFPRPFSVPWCPIQPSAWSQLPSVSTLHCLLRLVPLLPALPRSSASVPCSIRLCRALTVARISSCASRRMRPLFFVWGAVASIRPLIPVSRVLVQAARVLLFSPLYEPLGTIRFQLIDRLSEYPGDGLTSMMLPALLLGLAQCHILV